ncbi:MAG: hypothetical protein COV36_00265 [Alphaproteobacteria bacterium CG11_big_fil_rev_8_21_14_0_20_44_7]|nr:MAG: hypothetical protein COV36_00265 [Alphaproteobacteria bacterium CG11_big_fil_rev_8_21_14_0_20_44_7]
MDKKPNSFVEKFGQPMQANAAQRISYSRFVDQLEHAGKQVTIVEPEFRGRPGKSIADIDNNGWTGFCDSTGCVFIKKEDLDKITPSQVFSMFRQKPNDESAVFVRDLRHNLPNYVDAGSGVQAHATYRLTLNPKGDATVELLAAISQSPEGECTIREIQYAIEANGGRIVPRSIAENALARTEKHYSIEI